MYQIQITGPASKDIISLVNYISRRLQNPQAAEQHLAAIEKGIRDLKTMPLKYPLAADEYLSKRNIRCFPVKNYCVFYRVDEMSEMIVIIRVLYARSSWKELLKNEKYL